MSAKLPAIFTPFSYRQGAPPHVTIAPLTAAATSAASSSSSLFGGTPAQAAPASGASFGDMLSGAIGNVNSLQNAAAQQETSFALGKATDIHDVMIAAQKATVALNLTAAVRNKIVDAYQNVMSLQM